MARVSIEDCQKHIQNRFVLVSVAANRTRQLMSSSHPLISSKNKAAVTSMREIAEGKIAAKGAEEGDAITGELEAFLDIPLDMPEASGDETKNKDLEDSPKDLDQV